MESEDERASKREDRIWGCGADFAGCGCEMVVAVLLVPAVIFVLLR